MDRQTLTIGAALLAVVVVGLGIMFFMSGDSDDVALPPTGAGSEARSAIAEMQARSSSETAAPVAPQPRLIDRPASGGDSDTSTGAGAVTPAPVTPQPTGANPAVDEGYQEAKAFLAEGKVDDGLVMMSFLAMRQGHPQAAFDLASMYDPLLSATSPLDKPDPTQAYKNYGIAAAGGIDEANARLDALHEWAEEAAARGDNEAERVLLQWEQ